MRIFHVISGFENGGVETLIEGFIAHMPPADIHIIAHDAAVEACAARFRALGVTIHFIPCRKQLFSHMRALKRIFKEYQPDIVHVHTTERGFLPLIAAKDCGVPVRIQHSHAARSVRSFSNLLCAPLFWLGKRAATHYVACGKAAALAAFGKKDVERGRVTILKNGIDLSAFAYDPAVRESTRAAYNIESCVPVIGMVARFSRQKNHKKALDIFAAYQRRHPNAILLLVGEGKLRSRMERLASRLTCLPNIRFLGARKDLPALYAAMDRLILPSRFEGFPLVLVEAAASGLPAVVSDTVSKETAIAGLVSYCPIRDINQWCAALDAPPVIDRASGMTATTAAGFSIVDSALVLERLYREATH